MFLSVLTRGRSACLNERTAKCNLFLTECRFEAFPLKFISELTKLPFPFRLLLYDDLAKLHINLSFYKTLRLVTHLLWLCTSKP